MKQAVSATLYQKLVNLENVDLQRKIDNDKINDRSHLKDGCEYFAPDSVKIGNIIKAFGNLDYEVGYNQGYNFLISLLLRFIDCEEEVFWCLLVIMSNMNWRQCFLPGMPMMAKLQASIPKLFETEVPKLFQHIMKLSPYLMVPLSISFSQRCIMSVFTCIAPIEMSKKIMDYFIFQNCYAIDDQSIQSENCVLQVLFNMLKHVEDRCLKMDEDQLFDYLQKTNFISDCFEEMPPHKLFQEQVRF